MSMKTGLSAFAFAAALALGGQAAAATTVSSTFDTGTDGWGFGSWQGVGGAPQPVTYDPVADLISKQHGFGGWGFVAPEKFLGDKQAYAGGTLSFDLSSASSVYSGSRPLVVLSGANGLRMFSNWTLGPGAQLKTFNISLTADNFYTGGDNVQGPRVSDQVFNTIMGDLRQIEIYGDWSPNVDTVFLDNVILSGPAGVPEPATWALMIMGFGTAGAMLRRQRVVLA